ncbi:hypothetical protein PSPO01_04518 [Paraphaeosphaeria sporulosa]
MTDHLNLAAACISVVGFPHWKNQPLALLTIAAGALPGRWFNPVRIAHNAQDLTSDFFPLSDADEKSPALGAENITVDLSNPVSTDSSPPSRSSFESSHGVTSDSGVATPTPSTIYVPVSVENRTTTSSTPASVSHSTGKSLKFEHDAAVGNNKTVRNDLSLPEETAGQNEITVGNPTAVGDYTASQDDVSLSETPPANIDKERMSADEIIHPGVPTADETYENSTASWLVRLSSWLNKWFSETRHLSLISSPRPNQSASSAPSSATEPISQSTQIASSPSSAPSDVLPVRNNETNSITVEPPVSIHDSDFTTLLVPFLIASSALNAVLVNFGIYFWRLSKKVSVNPQPIVPGPVILRQSTITAVAAHPQPVNPSSVELEQSDISMTYASASLGPSPDFLQLSTIETIDRVPLDPSYANVQTQTDSVIHTLAFSSMSGVSVEPVPTALQKSDTTMVAQNTPAPSSYNDIGIQTSPTGLPYTDVGAQVEPVVPILGFSSIEQEPIDPAAVALQRSVVTTIFDAEPEPPPYTDAEAQVEPVMPALGFPEVKKLSVDPVPVPLPSNTNVGVQVEPFHPTLRVSSIEQWSVDPVSVPLPLNTNSGVQVEAVRPLLEISSNEQVSVEPAPVQIPYTNMGAQTEPTPLNYSKIEEVSMSPKPSLYGDAGVQVESFIPHLGISSIEQVSVKPVPVQLLCTDTGAQTESASLNYSKIEGVSSSPDKGFPVIHLCSGCEVAPSEHRCSGCHTAPRESDSGRQTDSAEVEHNGSSCEGDSFQIDNTESGLQIEPVQNKQKEAVAHTDPGAQMVFAEPTSASAPTVTQRLVHNPFSHGNLKPAHQQDPIDTLNHVAWPYGPTYPAPEGWRTREDFTYPLLSPPMPPDPNDPNVDKKWLWNQKRRWKNLRHLREKEAQLDYEEYVLGPGSASRSVERTEHLFRPQYKHMTEEERAKKDKEAKRLGQQKWRRQQWARNQKPVKAQRDGGQRDPSNFRVDHRNPRNLEAAGFELPIRLPSREVDDRAIGRPDDNVLVNPPQEEKAHANGPGPENPEEGQGPALLRFPAVDNRNPGSLEENVLVYPPSQEKARAKDPCSEESERKKDRGGPERA